MEDLRERKIYDPELEVEEQVNKARSFISLCQLQNSKKVEEEKKREPDNI